MLASLIKFVVFCTRFHDEIDDINFIIKYTKKFRKFSLPEDTIFRFLVDDTVDNTGYKPKHKFFSHCF